MIHPVLKNLPKVGIRPTIDGRLGGVRESLEKQTMAMAASTAALISSKLKYSTGEPVECVIADTCIGGIAEAAACAEKFRRENVGVSLTVTPCWCYGSETMDMDPHTPKAVWGFNGTERPGAVYLAAVLAAHTQKGLPAFGIYGRDVQDAGDQKIPADVAEKLLRFARAGLATATMRGRSYLAMGGTSMGIAGSIVDPSLFEKWLGMRVESVDMTEFIRRIERGIYDKVEFAKALKWVKANCKEGKDWNSPAKKRSRKQLDAEWETSVKMALIARDLMVGNPKFAKMGFGEEAQGHHAIASGFQGQRQWTDHMPNGDFLEAILNSSFDWNGRRAPYICATENDALNGAGMLFGNLLTNSAQIFADLRTYWSSEAIETASGKEFNHPLVKDGILHLINSGPAALDGIGAMKGKDGKPTLSDAQRAYLGALPAHTRELIAAAIDGACILLDARLRSASITLHKNLSPTDPQVIANRTKIEQVIVNLLQNAIEALADTSMPTITIETGSSATGHWIAIRDNGPGIPDAQRDELFVPFSSTKPLGLGLGLVICRDIMADLGGTLDFESVAGPGARFVARFPAREIA